MLHLLFGTDHFRLQERARALEQDFLATTPQGDKVVFDHEESWSEADRSLLVSSVSPGLFAISRFIVIRGAETFDESEGKQLIEILAHSDDTVTVVLMARLAGKKKLPKWISVLGKERGVAMEEFRELGRPEQSAYVDNFLKGFAPELSIEPRAKQFLLDTFAHDLGRLTQELTRLSLETTSKSITLAQVLSSVRPSMESATFAALDALIQGNRARAIALFRQEEQTPDAPFALLGLCAWQVRRLIIVKELAEKEHLSAAGIAAALKTSPYPIQKTLPLLSRLSFEHLRQALVRLADFDQAIKTGKLQPGVALDLFVWKF